MSYGGSRNTLTISLAEPVVFHRNVDASSTSLLRGLLVLEVSKPTKISSIELELTGKVKISWPQGTRYISCLSDATHGHLSAVGSRCIDITDEHEIFKVSTVFFRARSTKNGAKEGYKDFGKGASLIVQSKLR
jgi:hypothetical protein